MPTNYRSDRAMNKKTRPSTISLDPLHRCHDDEVSIQGQISAQQLRETEHLATIRHGFSQDQPSASTDVWTLPHASPADADCSMPTTNVWHNSNPPPSNPSHSKYENLFGFNTSSQNLLQGDSSSPEQSAITTSPEGNHNKQPSTTPPGCRTPPKHPLTLILPPYPPQTTTSPLTLLEYVLYDQRRM